ncbi:MAG: redoxin domain-containing protein [Proteobacteria bacterium]|nr:redoxin domain-containing protein [Pseudomonadota bacterium]
MRPELDRRGIQLVAICPERPEEIAKGRKKHGSKAIMLSDHDLKVTDRYNLVKQRNFAPKPGMLVPLPVPTTFLVDADGIVKWIDQADDYMVRSHPDRVRVAIDAVL